MVLCVNLELLNPLNQKKRGVYGNIPSELLTNLLFFCFQPLWFVASYFTAYPDHSHFFLLTAPDGSEQVPHSLLIFFLEMDLKTSFLFFCLRTSETSFLVLNFSFFFI
jgi:hypothetical protein